MKRTIFLLAAISILFSCSDDSEFVQNIDDVNVANSIVNSEKFEMFSGDWILSNITLDSGVKLIPPSLVDIKFSKEENDSITKYILNGISTCNLYGGEFLSLNNNKISFEQLYTTEVLCEENLNDFEIKYYEYLFKSEEYSIRGDILTLLSINNTSINFERVMTE